MDWLLRFFLQRFIRRGTLHVSTAHGTRFTCGDGTGTPIAVHFETAAAQRHILFDPEMALGESYMDGALAIDNASITDLLELLLGQPTMAPSWAKPLWLIRYVMRHIHQFNSRRRAKRNVARHYDLDSRLYSLFLDSTKISTTPNSRRSAISRRNS
jgi:cyclopropane-fatty-acyl-phospholipid synthase